jgi:hypothetical protein
MKNDKIKKIKDFVEFRYSIPYPELFDLMEKTDYLLTIMSPVLHSNYLSHQVSGNFGLSVGFQKPTIIQEEFAKVYKLNNGRSIDYKDDELYGAMKKAIDLPDDEYKKMQEKIGEYKNELYAKGLNTLRNALNQTN